jgi:hypothetical protein
LTKENKMPLLIIFLVSTIFAKDLTPEWIDESWRGNRYPKSEWYTGFSMDKIEGQPDLKAYEAVEKNAQNKLSESIIVNVKGSSTVQTASKQTKKGNNFDETIDINYDQTIKTTTSTILTKRDIKTYFDPQNGYIYAFTFVKKSDLANYYAQMIELSLNEARHGITLSKQLAELGKRNEAFQRLDQAKSRVESTIHFRVLLLTIDSENGFERSQTERANEMFKEITVARAEIEVKDIIVVFVTGTESMQNKKTDFVISGLQTIFTDNNIRVTENQKEATHILKTESKLCNQRSDGNFKFTNACVRVILTNTKTNKNELTISVTGPKEGGLTVENAGEKAFRAAASDVWTKVKEKF